MTEASLKTVILVSILGLGLTFYVLIYDTKLGFGSMIPRASSSFIFWSQVPDNISQPPTTILYGKHSTHGNNAVLTQKPVNTSSSLNTSHLLPSPTTSSVKNSGQRKHTLLTLFTSMSNSAIKEKVNNNTFYNWRMLFSVNVTAVLFTNNSHVGDHARQLGWIVLPILHDIPKDAGTPILPKMFQQVRTSVSSDLYGFVNGDILFDGSLMDTIKAIVQSPILSASTPVLSQNMMITGRRTNVQYIQPEDALSWTRLQTAAKSRGKLFILYSEDYFITTRGYPWETYPSIAVGVRAFDNWLVLRANQLSHTLIDCSHTILAVHQDTVKDGRFRDNKPNFNYNAELLQRLYGNVNYGLGQTSCCPYETLFHAAGTVYVNKRTRFC